ncbi:MAG TPA: ABC transporter ATP-binding protein [Vicinamibacteria bacterium]|nr:ABC transporter ATP-binding protein [Vicinamibacteria bacterium]
MTALRAEGIRFRYAAGAPPVLDGVSIAAEEGEVLGLLGPNGSGKSTLLRVISGALSPEAGAVDLCGKPVGALSRREAARVVAMVLPEGGRDLPFRVGALVLLGRAPYLGDLAWEGPEDFRIARDAMAMAGVDHLSDRWFDELSLGERQRVLVAQGLAQEPRVLLLDEPAAHLDIRHQVEIHALIERLAREKGMCVVAVSHDLNLAAEFCDRLVVLAGGRVRAEGTPAEVIGERLLREVYESRVLVDRNPESGTPRVTLLRN